MERVLGGHMPTQRVYFKLARGLGLNVLLAEAVEALGAFVGQVPLAIWCNAAAYIGSAGLAKS